MTIKQIDLKLKKAGVTSYLFHNEGIIFYIDGKSNWHPTPKDKTKLEHLEMIAIQLNRKVEAYGTKGLKSAAWQKTFPNAKALNAWTEKHDATVQGLAWID